MLAGKKTYIAAGLMALGAVGFYLAGSIDAQTLVQRILEAASIAGLRIGVESKK